MQATQVISKPKGVKSTKVGSRRLIQFDSFVKAIGMDPEQISGESPLTITVRRAQELSGLSRITINRMIWAGNVSEAA
jgi:hypothetical protein